MTTEGLLESPMRATDEAGVARVDDLLHDETLDLDGIEHHTTEQTITIPVRRQFHDGPERIIHSGLVWKTYEKEWMRSRVTIRHVRSWKAEHDQGINSYSFFAWRASGEKLVIECNEALVLTFETMASMFRSKISASKAKRGSSVDRWVRRRRRAESMNRRPNKGANPIR